MAKRSERQLVVQYVEKISRKLLERYPIIVREFARRQHGIYALYKGNKLCYVGLASNLRNRLRSHLRDRHGGTWDRFSMYLTLSDEHLRELESLVLCIASPKGNVVTGKFKKAKNLKRILKRKIREMQRLEQMDLLGEDIELPIRKNEDGEASDLGVLAPYTAKRFHIQFIYIGRKYIAHVRRNGLITFDRNSAEYQRFRGKRYKSPSGAGRAVTGSPCDGWMNWKYRNDKGEWVPLDNLRGGGTKRGKK